MRAAPRGKVDEMHTETMSVADVMLRDPVTVSRATRLDEFVDLAEREGVSGLPVVDGAGRVVGVVSLHDVVRALRTETEQALAPETGAPPAGLRGSEGDAAESARRRLGGRPGALGGSPTVPRTVADVMSTSVFSVRPETGVAEAARFLADAEVHRAPVLRDGRLVGLVTSFDLLRALSESIGA